MAVKTARRGTVDPFIVMEVMREANRRSAAGEGILHLEVGQPSTPAPQLVTKRSRSSCSETAGISDAIVFRPWQIASVRAFGLMCRGKGAAEEQPR